MTGSSRWPESRADQAWLAKVGYERMQEISDPALALERARATWQKHGRSDKWIQQRMTGQETRNFSRFTKFRRGRRELQKPDSARSGERFPPSRSGLLVL